MIWFRTAPSGFSRTRWWTNGVYLRVSDFGHTLQPRESFGHVWVRSVLGIGI
jgi:hypothetical protein